MRSLALTILSAPHRTVKICADAWKTRLVNSRIVVGMSPLLLDFRANAALTFLTRLTPLPTAICMINYICCLICYSISYFDSDQSCDLRFVVVAVWSEADGSMVFGVLSKYATVLYGNKWLPLSGSLLFSSRGLLCCVGMHEADL